jgi:hypothetical protein
VELPQAFLGSADMREVQSPELVGREDVMLVAVERDAAIPVGYVRCECRYLALR